MKQKPDVGFVFIHVASILSLILWALTSSPFFGGMAISTVIFVPFVWLVRYA